jgi:hypothetical protein
MYCNLSVCLLVKLVWAVGLLAWPILQSRHNTACIDDQEGGRGEFWFQMGRHSMVGKYRRLLMGKRRDQALKLG